MARQTAALACAAALVVGGVTLLTPEPPPAEAIVAAPLPETPRVHPDIEFIVLVSVDTLRADVLGPYGHPRAITPRFDALATESVLFEHHISAAPTTLASHTSMFTGKHPHNHGIPRNDYIVPDANRMLPEILGEKGWQTAAFLGAIPIASHSNFTQGFDHIDENFSAHRNEGVVDQTQRDGSEVNDALFSWLDSREDDRPLMMFVHYFDVHAPYLPPQKYRDMYKPDPTLKGAGTMQHLARIRRAHKEGSPKAAKHLETLQELYLAGVTWADFELGRLIDGLAERDILDKALFVVTADHGETFDSHSEIFDHGATVYDETVRTPLFVRFPKGWNGGHRVPEVVSNIDVTPTLLDLLALPAEPVEGRSLRILLSKQEGWSPVPVYAEATKPHKPVPGGWLNAPMDKAIRTDAHKLIVRPQPTETTELYDMVADPTEMAPLTEAGLEGRLRADLDRWNEQYAAPKARRDSSARRTAELAALGYME